MFDFVKEGPTLATIIGIDPGTTNLGICEFVFDFVTHEVKIIKAYTLRADRLYTLKNDWMIKKYGERVWRINCLQKRLLHIFKVTNADSVAFEHPFYNPKMPQAFQALLECKAAITNACLLYSPYVSPLPIDPSSIKNSVGAKGNAGKDPVREAVLEIYPKELITLPQGDLDEHSCDAIAVAHCKFTRLIGVGT